MYEPIAIIGYGVLYPQIQIMYKTFGKTLRTEFKGLEK